MALPLCLHTDARENLARWMDANFAAIEHLDTSNIKVFTRAGANNLCKARDANAHQFATSTLFALFTTYPFIVYILHCQLQCAFIVSTIEGPIKGRTLGKW